MTSSPGFFSLETPEDLMDKLRHDYKRICSNPVDSYAAFDFFVTARHLPEWLKRSGRPSPPLTDSTVAAALEIAGQIGNGAKHFVLEHKVKATEVHSGVFDPALFDPNIFDTDNLLITLNASDAAVIGQDTISVTELGSRVMAHWNTVFT